MNNGAFIFAEVWGNCEGFLEWGGGDFVVAESFRPPGLSREV